ncbi:hypothetical protein IAR50_000314 [Cryptococcus sp. DSM 104548]
MTGHPRSSAHNPPKGRKIIRGIQLKRGSACEVCRKRRIKCDGAKPHCSSCVRSLQYLERTHPGDRHTMQCHYAYDWDAEDDGRSSSGEEVDPGRPAASQVGETEAGQVEDTVRQSQSQDNDVPSAGLSRNGSQTSATAASIQGEAWASLVAEPLPMADFDPSDYDLGHFSNFQSFFDMGCTPMEALASLQGQAIAASNTLPIQSSPAHNSNPTRRTTVEEEDIDTAIQTSFKDLLWPGWPASLPAPSMVDHLVETFFATIPSVSRVIHRQSLLARLSLPPTHPEFPHKSLLHAICAVASRYTAAVYTRTVRENLEKAATDAKASKGKGLDADPENEPCFSEKHAMQAIAAIRLSYVNARGLFDMLQAVIVLGHWGQSVARWMDCWLMVGTASRLATCLELLYSSPPRGDNPYRRSILSPPKDDAEREERRAAIWYLVLYDVTGSASSGWPGTLPMDEITAKFPAARTDFDRGGTIPENPQSFISPDVYYNHPVADSFVMLSKGNMLLSRVIKFIRRCRRMEAHERCSATSLAEFRQIENDLGMFSLTFPAPLRDPVQYMQGTMKTIDADLIVAINLHEPFADIKDPMCPSANRLLAEARACLNIVYLIVSGSADVSYIVAPLTSCNYLFTATRTLALFYHRALETRDEGSAGTLYTEIAVFKHVFGSLATRHSMGVRHLTMIETIISTIEQETLGHPVVNGDFSGLGQQASGSHANSTPFSSRSNNSFHTAGYSSSQEVPHPTEYHPDALMINDLRGALSVGGSARFSGNFQDFLDQRRGEDGRSAHDQFREDGRSAHNQFREDRRSAHDVVFIYQIV